MFAEKRYLATNLFVEYQYSEACVQLRSGLTAAIVCSRRICSHASLPTVGNSVSFSNDRNIKTAFQAFYQCSIAFQTLVFLRFAAGAWLLQIVPDAFPPPQLICLLPHLSASGISLLELQLSLHREPLFYIMQQSQQFSLSHLCCYHACKFSRSMRVSATSGFSCV